MHKASAVNEKMIILAILALAVLADGYRIDNPSERPNPLRMLCEKNGANYFAVEGAGMDFVRCMEDNFGVRIFESEIKNASMYHSYEAYNQVFKKYCYKSPELKTCFYNLLKVTAPCLGTENQDLVTVTINVNDAILDYLCEDNGLTMTEFMMEGGPQCFKDRSYEIMMCAEKSKYTIMATESYSVNATYAEQNNSLSKVANIYDELVQCVVSSVKTCRSQRPYEIAKKLGSIIHQTISKGALKVDNPTKIVELYSTTERDRYNQRLSYTTERDWYNQRPSHTTGRHWYNQRPSSHATERNWYQRRSSTTTDDYRYINVRTSEKPWHPTASWQNEKVADGDQPNRPLQKKTLQMICEQNGGNYTDIEEAGAYLVQCMENNFGMAKLENEIRNAYFRNHTYYGFNAVFSKYCHKSREVKDCIQPLRETVALCLASERHGFLKATNNINDQVLSYLCENDGDILTTFFMEGGQQCIGHKGYEIMACSERSEKSIMSMERDYYNNKERIITFAKFANVLNEYLQCVVRTMETCRNQKPSKIVKRVASIIQESISQGGFNPTVTEKTWSVNGTLQNERAVLADGYLDNVSEAPNPLRMLCEKNGANYFAVEDSVTDFVRCLENNFGVKMYETEIKNASMYHSYEAYNQVFKKYCYRSPQLKACFYNIQKVVAPCVGTDLVTVTINVNDAILDYLCEDNGLTMTEFMMEGGPQCFHDRSYEIMMGVEKWKYTIMATESYSVNATYAEQNNTLSKVANIYDELVQSVVSSVKTCRSQRPYEIVKKIGSIIHQTISKGALKVDNPSKIEELYSTTERDRYNQRPSHTTGRHWYNQRPSSHATERNWYQRRPSTTTDDYRYINVRTSEKPWHPTASWQTEKAADGDQFNRPLPQRTLRMICEQNGGNYTDIEEAAAYFVPCIENNFELTKFVDQIKEDRFRNHTYYGFNAVFSKYCHKSREVKHCIQPLRETVALCLAGEIQGFLKATNNINDQVLSYLCENDGDILTTFIMEGGHECIEDKRYEIMACSERSKKSIMSMERDYYNNKERIITFAKFANVLNEYLQCVVQTMETCRNQKPSKIVKRVASIIQESISQGGFNPTVTEKTWSLNGTLQNERGASTNNLLVLLGQNGIYLNTDGIANITSNTPKKLIKASGNITVAFNADFYV